MKQALLGFLAGALLIGTPILMGAASGDEANRKPQPRDVIQVIDYARKLLQEKGDEGILAIAHLAKADVLRKMGRGEDAVQELRAVASSAQDREILVVSNAALIKVLRMQSKLDESLVVLDTLIAKVGGQDRESGRN